MIRSVAVIGVGSLGEPIARRMLECGYEVTVCDRDQQALDVFSSTTAVTTLAAADCAKSDIVLVLVATPEQARAVLTGDGGLLTGVTPTQRPIIGMVSTISREVVVELASAAYDAGICLLDIPVSGGPPRALDGTLTVLAAGDDELITRVEPVLTHLGRVFRCGAVGDAQVVKLINNVICAANVAITGEVLRLALACDLRLDQLLPVLEVSTGRNFLSPSAETAAARLRGWTTSEAAFESTLAIVRKDVRLAARMAESTRTGRYEAIEGLLQLLDGLSTQTFEHWRVAGGAGETS